MRKLLLILLTALITCSAAYADDKPSGTAGGGGDAAVAGDPLAQGDQLADQDKYDAAIAAYKAVLVSDPNSAKAHQRLALVYLEKGNSHAAELEDREAIKLDPKDAAAYQHLGLVAGTEHNYDSAIASEKSAISIKPDYQEAYAVLGKALSSSGRYDEATVALHKAISLDPTDFDSYTTLGAAYGRQSKYQESVDVYQKATALNPKSWVAHMGLGRAYGHLGYNKMQIEELKLAVKFGEHDASAHGYLGSALTKAGDIKGAIAEGTIANRLRFGHYWPSVLNKFLLGWACVFIVFGLIFAVMFAGSVFKPQSGEVVIKSFFLVFYKDRPGRFIITSRRFLYIPEAFSRWFGSTRVSIERDLIAKLTMTKTLTGGIVAIDTADGSALVFKMTNLIYSPLTKELDNLGYSENFENQTETLHLNTKKLQQ